MRTLINVLLGLGLMACAGGDDGRGCSCRGDHDETGRETAPPDTNETGPLPDDSGEETGEELFVPELGEWSCGDEGTPLAHNGDGSYEIFPVFGRIIVEDGAGNFYCGNCVDPYRGEGVFTAKNTAEIIREKYEVNEDGEMTEKIIEEIPYDCFLVD